MKHTPLYAALTALALALPASFGNAAPVPENPARQTELGLYQNAQEAFEMKQELAVGVLFVDIRDPVEIMFTGFTDVVDTNIPFKLVDTSQWHPKKPMFAMAPNPSFTSEVIAALHAQGLTKSSPVILMCRSGSRVAPAADMLSAEGFEQVYVLVDGFEGASLKDNAKGPWRLKEGWKNSGLPWSYDLNPQKVLTRPQ